MCVKNSPQNKLLQKMAKPSNGHYSENISSSEALCAKVFVRKQIINHKMQIYPQVWQQGRKWMATFRHGLFKSRHTNISELQRSMGSIQGEFTSPRPFLGSLLGSINVKVLINCVHVIVYVCEWKGQRKTDVLVHLDET